jgi:signal peptidase II
VTGPREFHDSTPSLRPSWRLVWLLIGLAAVTVLIDQVSKTVVVGTMTEGEEVTVINHFFYLIFVRNAGAAFSMVSGQTWIFSILAVLVIGVIIWAIRRIHSRAWAVVFGLLLGGTIGNLIDRLFREPGFGVGHVIDFLNLPWLMPAIFNVADIAISAAAVTFVILVLLGIGLNGKRSRNSESLGSNGERGLS